MLEADTRVGTEVLWEWNLQRHKGWGRITWGLLEQFLCGASTFTLALITLFLPTATSSSFSTTTYILSITTFFTRCRRIPCWRSTCAHITTILSAIYSSISTKSFWSSTLINASGGRLGQVLCGWWLEQVL